MGILQAMESTNPPIELSPVDIEPWRHGNTGIDWVHVLDSGKPGPTVLVQALTHGNELCGAIALDGFLQQRVSPLKGRLILVFANVEAYARFDPRNPNASRCVDEDLNRVWGDDQLFGSRDSVELRRARQLQPLVDASDQVLDLHSMSEPCAPLMVCGKVDKNAQFARQLGLPELLMLDTGHPAGLRMVDRGGFGDPASPKRALLIECGQHWERSSADVAHDALSRFLALTGMVSPQWAASSSDCRCRRCSAPCGSPRPSRPGPPISGSWCPWSPWTSFPRRARPLHRTVTTPGSRPTTTP